MYFKGTVGLAADEHGLVYAVRTTDLKYLAISFHNFPQNSHRDLGDQT